MADRIIILLTLLLLGGIFALIAGGNDPKPPGFA